MGCSCWGVWGTVWSGQIHCFHSSLISICTFKIILFMKIRKKLPFLTQNFRWMIFRNVGFVLLAGFVIFILHFSLESIKLDNVLKTVNVQWRVRWKQIWSKNCDNVLIFMFSVDILFSTLVRWFYTGWFQSCSCTTVSNSGFCCCYKCVFNKMLSTKVSHLYNTVSANRIIFI